MLIEGVLFIFGVGYRFRRQQGMIILEIQLGRTVDKLFD
jgi:hypothetical protein